MWPWEHAAFGYALYRGFLGATGRPKPDDREVLALVVATQFPDLVDKPLAWYFGLLPSGLSLAHSLLFAGPLCLSVIYLARRQNSAAHAEAFTVGYFSHLLGDGLFGLFTSGRFTYEFMLWPLLRSHPEPKTGFLFQVTRLLEQFGQFLATPRGQLYIVLEGVFVCVVLIIWATDGFPGVGLR